MRTRVYGMSEADPLNKIIAPFLVHGLCRDKAEILQMLAQDYVQRQICPMLPRLEALLQIFPAFHHDVQGNLTASMLTGELTMDLQQVLHAL